MTENPFNVYRSMMDEVKAPPSLPDRVLQKTQAQKNVVKGRETLSTHDEQTYRATVQHIPKRSNRRTPKKLAAAACLALLAIVVGTSLALPGISTNQNRPPFDFAVQAYGASQDIILSMGSDGTIVFDIDSNLPIPPDEQYAQLGVYTGCLFRIEGEGIVRIQANVDRGELYRYSSEEFVKSSNPELWKAALSWKQTKIGEDGPFARYDMVQSTGGNDGKNRKDPDKLVGIKYYQRMGETVDMPVDDSDGSRLSDYCFGLWTNEDRSGLTQQDEFAASVDTLDGAKLTITVERSDGSCSTKVIELRSADVKANIVSGGNGGSSSLQLVPEIIDLSSKSEEDIQDDYVHGFTTVHTLYGTIVDQNGSPFPCGEASHPTLDKPLTDPIVLAAASAQK